jgi:phage terminase large subunit GpA-like protein
MSLRAYARHQVFHWLLSRRQWRASAAASPTSKFAIDSGYATPRSNDWIRQHGKYEGIAIKGDSRAPGPVGQASPVEVGPRGQRIQFGIKIWPVNTGMIKEEFYRWLHLIPEPDESEVRLTQEGYCHFPKYSEEYFKQLTAEQLVTRVVKGYKRPEWQKTRDRNEALDCRVYARAAAAVFGLDRFNEDRWAALESKLTASPAPKPMPVKELGYHPRGWIDKESTKNWMKRGRDW